LAGVTVLNLATFAPPWQVTLPGLRFWPALFMSQASTALSIVMPAGAAVGLAGSYGLLRSLGFQAREVARGLTLTGLWNQFANLSYPIVAVFLLTVTGGESPLLATVAFIGVAVLGLAVGGLVLVLAGERTATGIGDLSARVTNWALGRIGRGPVAWRGPSFERFRRDAVWLLRRRWHLLTLATLAGSLSVFLVLLLSLRALGVPASEVSAVEAFAAWALVRLIGSIPITPGGVGIVELGLTGALVGFDGNNAGVVAAVLVFRVLTVLPTLILGLIAVATWRRHAPVIRDAAG
jgi:putative heme transporter